MIRARWCKYAYILTDYIYSSTQPFSSLCVKQWKEGAGTETPSALWCEIPVGVRFQEKHILRVVGYILILLF